MELSSLVPMSSSDVLKILDGSLEKMNNYCRSATIKNLNSNYSRYLQSFTFFCKKKSLIEWCNLKDTDWGFPTTKAKRHAYTWNYDGFINSTIANAKMSSNGMLYLSDEDTKLIRSILYRTTNIDELSEVEKIKSENLELWNYLIEKKII